MKMIWYEKWCLCISSNSHHTKGEIYNCNFRKVCILFCRYISKLWYTSYLSLIRKMTFRWVLFYTYLCEFRKNKHLRLLWIFLLLFTDKTVLITSFECTCVKSVVTHLHTWADNIIEKNMNVYPYQLGVLCGTIYLVDIQ